MNGNQRELKRSSMSDRPLSDADRMVLRRALEIVSSLDGDGRDGSSSVDPGATPTTVVSVRSSGSRATSVAERTPRRAAISLSSRPGESGKH